MEGWIRSPQEVMQRFRALQLAHCRARKQRQQLNERHAAAAEAAQRAVANALQPQGITKRKNAAFSPRAFRDGTRDRRAGGFSSSSLASSSSTQEKQPLLARGQKKSFSLKVSGVATSTTASRGFQNTCFNDTSSAAQLPLICIQTALPNPEPPRSSPSSSGNAGKSPVSEEAEAEARAMLLPWVQFQQMRMAEQQLSDDAGEQESLRSQNVQRGAVAPPPPNSVTTDEVATANSASETSGGERERGGGSTVSPSSPSDVATGGVDSSSSSSSSSSPFPTVSVSGSTEGSTLNGTNDVDGADISSDLLSLLLEHDQQATVTASEKDKKLFRESRPFWLDRQLRAFQLVCSQQQQRQQRFLLPRPESKGNISASHSSTAASSALSPSGGTTQVAGRVGVMASPINVASSSPLQPTEAAINSASQTAGTAPCSGSAAISGGSGGERASLLRAERKAGCNGETAGSGAATPGTAGVSLASSCHSSHNVSGVKKGGGAAVDSSNNSKRRSVSLNGLASRSSLRGRSNSCRRRRAPSAMAGGAAGGLGTTTSGNNPYNCQMPIRSDSTSWYACKDRATIDREKRGLQLPPIRSPHLASSLSATSTATPPQPLSTTVPSRAPSTQTAGLSAQDEQRLASLLLSFFVRDVPEEERKLRDLQLTMHAKHADLPHR